MIKNEKIYDAIEFNNIKEIIYNSAKVYGEKVAYVIKHKDKKEVYYENVTYKRLLDDAKKEYVITDLLSPKRPWYNFIWNDNLKRSFINERERSKSKSSN